MEGERAGDHIQNDFFFVVFFFWYKLADGFTTNKDGMCLFPRDTHIERHLKKKKG